MNTGTQADIYRHEDRQISALLIDAICETYDLQLVPQRGDRRTLYAVDSDTRTVPVATVGLLPRTLEPRTTREDYQEALDTLRGLGWEEVRS